jgi:hypothetical protein
MIPADGALAGSRLTDAISAAMVELYAEFYEHARTTATTYINDSIVVCVLENILSADGTAQIGDGRGSDVIDGPVAFQEGAEDEFTGAIERLTHRSVTAFLSANQTAPGVACELFFLEAPPVAALHLPRRGPRRGCRAGGISLGVAEPGGL